MAAVSTNPFLELSEAWMSLYPTIHWLLHHPVLSLILGFLGLYLLWGLLRGLVQITENLWIRLLKSPWWLAKILWEAAGRRLHLIAPGTIASSAPASSQRDRLLEVIAQLEALQREQSQLLQAAKEQLQNLDRVR
ncbi:hypothetical protein [Lyngbya confervoides]|uniref:Uncharacterized protein n=1 Tax=Lyngbya confervoides BDU141951 TaxID=1574623 RepID=A0ABD4SYX6_9CYAN|nr:hypothetical protein [Lyngbya confervoides]MCM1981463.1 hypothetical protein [Lyngbya confervoides BDU141951]